MKIPQGIFKGLTVIITLCVIGYIVWIRFVPVFRDQEETTPAMSEQESVSGRKQKIPVQVIEAQRTNLIKRISVQGTVIPLREIPIVTLTAGRLVSVPVFEGMEVKSGVLLAQIDDKENLLEFNEAENSLNKARLEYVFRAGNVRDTVLKNGENSTTQDFIENAKKEWADAKNLLESGSISQLEYNDRKKNYDIAEALSNQRRNEVISTESGLSSAETSFERAKMNLDNTRITAPISGVVAQLSVEEGQYVGNNTGICSIIDINKVRIETGVLEPEIGFLEIGRKAKISFSAYPGRIFEGYVETISPVIENTTCKVTLLLDNSEKLIKPGMFAFVEIDAQIFEDRLLVPKEAVIPRQERELIFVVRDGKAVWNYVTTGLRNDEFIEILNAREGLEPGEQVVVSGHFTLGHDVPVRIVKSLDPTK